MMTKWEPGLEPEIMYPTDQIPRDLEPYYSRHVNAMTRDGLVAKGDIAEQLAWRDKLIDTLRNKIVEMERLGESAEYELSAALDMTTFEPDGSIADIGAWPLMIARIKWLMARRRPDTSLERMASETLFEVIKELHPPIILEDRAKLREILKSRLKERLA